MGKPLQILLAVTCLAVLAVIGYFTWQQLEAGRQAERVAEYRRARDLCLNDVARRKTAAVADIESLDALISFCINDGLVTAEDLD